MKQIYIIGMFSLSFCCFSQLHIQPGKHGSSFMYVEGELLFVEKDINLQINLSQETKASLYLRDEGQLLQGEGNYRNTGDGLLSVFQEGKATAYTYNYWSAPVENVSESNRFGNIFFEPVTKTHSLKAHITSELNGKAQPLKISNRWIYKLSGRGYADWVYVGENFNVAPGEGFTMKGVEGTDTSVELYGVPNNPGNEQRYDFRGKPNSGLISLPVKTEELKLIGNPYPSALDLNAFLIQNTAITGIAYFWDSKPVSSHYVNDYVGGYGAYSPAVGTNGYVPAVFVEYDHNGNPTNETGNTGFSYARRYAPIAQGFIVEGLNTGSILFQNKFRVFEKENPVTSQFKSSATISENVPFIRMNVEIENQYVRQLLLAFHPEATTDNDRAMDAENLTVLETDAGWWMENKNFLIDVRPLNITEKIPIVVNAANETNISFRVVNTENFFEEIYLHDTESDLYYNLRNENAAFSITENNTERFKITFSKKGNKEDLPEIFEPEEKVTELSLFHNNELQQLEIKYPNSSFPESITLFDINGRKILEVKGNNTNSHHSFSTALLSRGAYIVKIKSSNGSIISKKVIISK